MDKKRASEISHLPEMANVTYNGEPVYIENVNPNRDMCSIHTLSHPANSWEVHVTQLVESESSR